MFTDELLALPSVTETLKKSGLPVYLYGTGDGADKILDFLVSEGISVQGVFASEGFVRDRTFRSLRVESLADIERREGKIAAVQCFGLEGIGAFDYVMPLREKHLLLAPSLPVYGGGRLDHAALRERRAEAERVYGWLADSLSKELYKRVLAFHLTGDIAFLEDSRNTFSPPKAYFAHTDIHLDVGAYDGDTAREYLAENPRVQKILAFEPNAQTFRKLQASTDPSRITCFCAACGAKDGFASQEGSGRGSHVQTGVGGLTVRALDSVCGYPFVNSDGMRIGSLKIDAEGEDAAVLCGAANLLTACRPAVCVSAYHRAYDLFSLPTQLKCLDYRTDLFFRKKPYIPAWDTVFYSIPRERSI